MSEGPPLYIDPRVAWRTWAIDQGPRRAGRWAIREQGEIDHGDAMGGDGRLTLVSGGSTEWPARERLVARCRMHPGGDDHRPPEAGCSCGVYAARSHRALREMGYAAGPDDPQAPDVVGEVSLWGRMWEQPDVLRAQFAYPKRLFVPHLKWRWAKPLADTYGVPVEIKNVFTMEVE